MRVISLAVALTALLFQCSIAYPQVKIGTPDAIVELSKAKQGLEALELVIDFYLNKCTTMDAAVRIHLVDRKIRLSTLREVAARQVVRYGEQLRREVDSETVSRFIEGNASKWDTARQKMLQAMRQEEKSRRLDCEKDLNSIPDISMAQIESELHAYADKKFTAAD